MRTIKKYSNRRLYDTTDSQYITQDELAEIIRAGDDVRVVSAKEGQDLTQSTLAAIILESRGAGKLLPVPLLLQLIRMDDAELAEFLGYTMSWALAVYNQAKRGVQTMQQMNPFSQFMPQQAYGQNPFAQFGGWPGNPWGQQAGPTAAQSGPVPPQSGPVPPQGGPVPPWARGQARDVAPSAAAEPPKPDSRQEEEATRGKTTDESVEKSSDEQSSEELEALRREMNELREAMKSLKKADDQ